MRGGGGGERILKRRCGEELGVGLVGRNAQSVAPEQADRNVVHQMQGTWTRRRCGEIARHRHRHRYRRSPWGERLTTRNCGSDVCDARDLLLAVRQVQQIGSRWR